MTAFPPDEVVRAVERTLAERSDRAPRVENATRVSGGCINPSARLRMDDGTNVFVKCRIQPSCIYFTFSFRGEGSPPRPGLDLVSSRPIFDTVPFENLQFLHLHEAERGQKQESPQATQTRPPKPQLPRTG